MLIDCSTCTARPAACADCVVSCFLDLEPVAPVLEREDLAAIEVLSLAGFVPPLRLATG